MRDGEFRDERLVALYDLECPWSRDDDYFLSVLAEEPATDVLDLGCGTGRLAIALADRGYHVTGIDPAAPSLELARGKAGADKVTWIEGSAEAAPPQSFDAALMTSHVAQFLVSDDEFAAALAQLRRALRPGGRLVFDTRDPAAQAWTGWTEQQTRHTLDLPGGGTVDLWVEVESVVNDAVTFVHRYVFSDGDRRESIGTLRFRPEPVLRAALSTAGFAVEQIHGGWNRDPVGHPDGEFLVTARAATPRRPTRG